MLRTQLFPICLCLMVSISLAQAADALDQTISIRIWGDRPSEMLHEVNAHLPPHLRLAWHVDKTLDASILDAPVIEVEGQSIRSILDEYTKKTDLRWGSKGSAVWVWREADSAAAAIEAATGKLNGGNAQEQAAAVDSLLKLATPKSIAALLQAYATGSDETKAAAYRGIRVFLGVKPNGFNNGMTQAFQLLGHPDKAQTFNATMGELGSHREAPWAAAVVTMQDAGARQAVTTLMSQEGIAKNLPILVFGVCGGLEEVKPHWAHWSAGKMADIGYPHLNTGPRWGVGYVSGKAKAAENLLLLGKGPAAADYDAKAAGLTELLKQLNPAAVQELGAKLKELAAKRDELKKDKKKNRDALKAVEGEMRPYSAKLGAIKKARSSAMKMVGNFKGYGEACAKALAGFVTQADIDPLLRQTAARTLQQYRVESIIPELITVCREDDQPNVRKEVAVTLGMSRSAAGIDALKTDLSDTKSPSTRKNGIRGLVKSRHPQTGDWILAQLEATTEAAERQEILQYLGFVRSKAVEKFLIGLATDAGGNITERLSAVAALSSNPTPESRKTLQDLITNGNNATIQMQAITAFTPRTQADIDKNLPILLNCIATLKDEALLKPAIQGVILSARALPNADPRKRDIAHKLLALIQQAETSNNSRKEALNGYKYTLNDQAIVDGLTAASDKIPGGPMKSFFRIAIKNAQKNMVTE